MSDRPRLRVALTTLGCKRNQYDSAALLGRLDPAAFEWVPFDREADVYIVNSCTVTQLAERQSRKFLYQARRRNPVAQLVVWGCYATMDPDALRQDGVADHVVPQRDDVSIVALLHDIARAGGLDPLPVDHGPHFVARSRPFLKVQDGCEACCSYCVIPSVRGPVRSSSVETVIRQLDLMADQDTREVVLTGIHVGQWGRDLPGRPGLSVLLDAIGRWGRIPRVRLSSLEPLELTDAVLDAVAGHACFCHHLHIPLQSGSDAILSAMRRPYTTARFRERITRAVERLERLGLGLDLIVGFPGETEAHLNETLTFLDDLPYHYGHVFPYSERPGTLAASMPGRVDMGRRKERARRVAEHVNASARRMALAQVGRTLPVLVERGPAPDGRRRGYSDSYYEVRFDSDPGLKPGEIVQADILGLLPDTAVLHGRRHGG